MRRVEELPAYSVAIRTLGVAGEAFQRELQSLTVQTLSPERVIVYVAEDFEGDLRKGSVCGEEYVYVQKGMVAQRALRYDEIETDYVLLLDDDVELAPDSAEKMLNAMIEKEADCVGADTYRHQEGTVWQKLYTLATNLDYPHCDRKWAFKIHRNGSFSYLWRTPHEEKVLPTQYVAGPCAMWRKDAIQRLRWEDEIWMDREAFAYMDDTVESYKLHVNGGKMFLHYDTGVKNLNAKTASSVYRSKSTRFYVRAKMGFCVWWRTIYEVEKSCSTAFPAVVAYTAKTLWSIFMSVFAVFFFLDISVPFHHIRGLVAGWRFVHSEEYRRVGRYILN
ncbi:MAG: glycosyltransferase [Prevotellaceae bacterium]|nr:glycosyltransferase [Prevotellaceae bacterium]